MDRLSRTPEQFERDLDTIHRAGGFVAAAKQPVDTTTEAGRHAAMQFVRIGALEVGTLARRSRDTQEGLARDGLRSGGVRQFGINHARDGHQPDETALICEAADRILNQGWSWKQVARDWQAKGVVGTRGRPMDETTVRRVLTSQTTAGFRLHRGHVVADAPWPPILDRATWQGLRDRLQPRQRGGTHLDPPGYLLTGGLARCAECDYPLVAGRYIRHRDQVVAQYRCPPNRRHAGACGSVYVVAAALELHVVNGALHELARPGWLDQLGAILERGDPTIAAGRRTLGLLRYKLQQVEQCKESSGRAEYERWQATIEERRRLAEEALDEQRTILGGGVNPWTLPRSQNALNGAFWLFSLDLRRAVLRLVVSKVLVRRACVAGARFDPARVAIQYRK